MWWLIAIAAVPTTVFCYRNWNEVVSTLNFWYSVGHAYVKSKVNNCIFDLFSPMKLNRGLYTLDYFFNSHKYTLPFYIQDVSPEQSDILYISNESGKDLTEEVLRYAGPDRKFHGQALTPEFFDSEKLIVTYLDSSETIGKNQEIKLT